jgi:hypothetical protein
MYADGDRVPRDEVEAFGWYSRAAMHGDPEAERYMGHAYLLGLGVPRNLHEAIRWLRRAAGRGDAPSQLVLARAYRLGQNVPRDYAEATRWYLRFAWQIVRRVGWAPPLAILLGLAAVLTPERLVGRARWLSWALTCAACLIDLAHLLSRAALTGRTNPVASILLATVALVSAAGVAAELMRSRNPAAPPGNESNPAALQ